MSKTELAKKKLFTCMLMVILCFPSILAALPNASAQEYLFTIYPLIPDSSIPRIAFANVISQEWVKLGIDVRPKIVPFSVIYEHENPKQVWRLPYEQGGYDVVFERWSSLSMEPPSPSDWLSTSLPPTAYHFWNDSKSDELLKKYLTSTDEQQAKNLLIQWQDYFYEEIPAPTILYLKYIYAINSKLSGFNSPSACCNLPPTPESWVKGGETDATVIWANPADPVSFSPLAPNILYMDINAYGPVFDYLARLDWQTRTYQPDLAVNWAVSDGANGPGTHWVIDLREGVKWHDGWEFTADDVKATWDWILTKEAGSAKYGTFMDILGGKDAYKTSGKYQITVDLPKPTLFFTSLILSSYIAPAHIINSMPADQVTKSSFNKASGPYTVKRPDGTDYTANGPIGTGPYIFRGWDPTKRTATMERNPDYWKKIEGNVRWYKATTIQAPDAAIASLKNGEIDIIDTNAGIEGKQSLIDPAWGTIVTWPSQYWHRFTFNMAHPIFGTGVQTPLGIQDPSRAAEAARYVRQALNLAIPRDAICKEIMYGLAQPGIVPIMPGSKYFDTNLKPYEYSLDKARDLLAKAGYVSKAAQPTFMELYGVYIGAIVGAIVAAVAVAVIMKRRGKPTKT